MTDTPRSTLLQRFGRDVSGNVMVIMAASVLPMVGAVGSAIDISRLYMTKSRLQQACDAGVLAGRKKQGGDSFATSGAQPEANEYFAINFPTGTYQATNITFNTHSVNENEVVGAAGAFVPASVGKVIGFAGRQIDVTCSAKFDLANTDVMFVLDVSGSMDEGSGTSGVTRIQALRAAVSSFHQSLESAKRPGVQVRYGFVAYSNTVNVGELLKPISGAIDGRHDYQTRQWIGEQRDFPASYSGCNSDPNRLSWSNGQCRVSGFYRHSMRTLTLNNYRAGGTETNPAYRDGRTMTWPGCIEERGTVVTDTYTPLPADAWDLNVDAGGGTDAREWKMQLDALYRRNPSLPSEDFMESKSNGQRDYSDCPSARAQIVKAMTASQVTSYVNTLVPKGGTYHDVGMIWGVRLMSPNGLWGSTNTSKPNAMPISRHIIFMTDGLMNAQLNTYGVYGLEELDRRVGGGSISSNTNLSARHNARFLAMCDVARTKGIRVWTVAFGTRLADTRLRECADDARAFEATNATELNETFRRIALRISELRLEQ